MISFMFGQVGFDLRIGNRCKAEETDGIERSIELLSVGVGGVPLSGHHAGLFSWETLT
jgi:hypothetical protein